MIPEYPMEFESTITGYTYRFENEIKLTIIYKDFYEEVVRIEESNINDFDGDFWISMIIAFPDPKLFWYVNWMSLDEDDWNDLYELKRKPLTNWIKKHKDYYFMMKEI